MTISEKKYMAGSAFAYVDFDYAEDGTKLEIKEVAKQYGKTLSELHAEQRYGNLGPESKAQLPDFDKEKVFQSVDDWKLINYQNKNDTTGFCASAYETPDGHVVFAFRGTEPGVNDHSLLPEDAKPDAMIGLSQDFTKKLPPQFEDAKTFIKTTLGKKYNFDPDTVTNDELKQYVAANNVTSTGHSLGGGESEYFTYLTEGRSVTFNAVGIGQNFGLTPEAAAKFNAVNIANKDDMVGHIGLHLGEQRDLDGTLGASNWRDVPNMITKAHGMDTMLQGLGEDGNFKNSASNEKGYAQEFSDNAKPYLTAAGQILKAKGIIDVAQGVDYIHDGWVDGKRTITNFEEAKDNVIKKNMVTTKTNADAIADSSRETLKQEQSKFGHDIEQGKAVINDGVVQVAAVVDANSEQIDTGLHTAATRSRDVGYGLDVTGAVLNTAHKVSNGDSISQAIGSEAQERWDHITQGVNGVKTGLTDVKNGIVKDYNGIKDIVIQETDKISPALSNLYGNAKAMYNTVDKGLHDIHATVSAGQDNTDREVDALRDVRNDKLIDSLKDLGQGALHIAKGAVLGEISDTIGVGGESTQNAPESSENNTQQASSTDFWQSNPTTVQVTVLQGDSVGKIADAMGTTPDKITNAFGQRVYFCNPNTVVNVETHLGMSGDAVYKAQPGDNWGTISERTGVSYDELRKNNQNVGEVFNTGTIINYPKHLTLDGQAINSATTKSQENSNPAFNAIFLPRQLDSTTIPVKVLEGDSLVKIANALNITSDKLINENGQQVYVCNPNAVIHAEVHLGTNGNVLYQAQPGDNWETISSRTGVSYNELRAANPNVGEGFNVGIMLNAPRVQEQINFLGVANSPSQSASSSQPNFNQQLNLSGSQKISDILNNHINAMDIGLQDIPGLQQCGLRYSR